MLIRKWKTFILFGFPTLQEDVEDGQPLPASTTGWRLISSVLQIMQMLQMSSNECRPPSRKESPG
ncbi:uncharacterized protein LOC142580028 isoform X8 [Dermacentor variabilis]|uniref:uncharacterized protein LOC142580028 isoform X8 n=1 Tax=Dermacentor variabilis TaxID=34621 RepID=UPI003F5B6B41